MLGLESGILWFCFVARGKRTDWILIESWERIWIEMFPFLSYPCELAISLSNGLFGKQPAINVIISSNIGAICPETIFSV